MSSASVHCLPSLSFIVPISILAWRIPWAEEGYISWSHKLSNMTQWLIHILTWNVPLISPIFLQRSPVFSILLFSSNSLHCSLRRISYISLLFSGTFHSVESIFPFLCCLSLLFSLPICIASSDNYFVFLYFSLG